MVINFLPWREIIRKKQKIKFIIFSSVFLMCVLVCVGSLNQWCAQKLEYLTQQQNQRVQKNNDNELNLMMQGLLSHFHVYLDVLQNLAIARPDCLYLTDLSIEPKKNTVVKGIACDSNVLAIFIKKLMEFYPKNNFIVTDIKEKKSENFPISFTLSRLI